MSNRINTTLPIIPLQPSKVQNKPKGATSSDFQVTFREQLAKEEKLKFSAHAQRRLAERNIHFDEKDLKNIEQAVERAQAKGARESLLLYGDIALIASIKNKTVVTAVDGQSMGDQVFTNIDSALIIKRQEN